MNGIIGFANLLLNTPLEREQKAFAGTIRHSSEALLTIINDILDFSKIESGKVTLEHISWDVREALGEVIALVSPQASEKGLALAIDVADDVPRLVRGDPARVRQVTLNLVGNAVKFTAKGHVLLKVSWAAGELLVSVEDTGVGIPSETVPRLFTRFTQADGSTTRRFGGTGLGLAISRGIVALMGGQLDLESTVGVGSTFRFRVPAPLEAPREPLRELAAVRVMLVVAEAFERRLLARQLERSGATVTAVATVAQVSSLSRVDLCVVDGHVVLPPLRRQPGLPVVVLADASQAAAREDGGVVITRPVTRPDLMLASLSAALGRTTLDCTPVPAAPQAPPFAGRSALLVEDNVINQRLAQHLLKKLGFSVVSAWDGFEALERLGEGRFDVVLMDCHMPRLDGYETTERIRRQWPDEHLPVIAVTAGAMAGDRERCLAAGMNDYLTKPLREQDLVALLHRWLGLRAAA
jgi:CheY-like chemotaxis protein